MPRGRHRRPPAGPVPLVRAAFGAVVLATLVAGVPVAAPAATVPGAVPVLAAPAVFPADRVEEVAAVAVRAALDQLGLPYEWGGDGPAAGETGFDCSGLTRHAYAVAGIDLPRTAHTQFYAGPGVPDGDPLRPGDLVFYGVPDRVYHVGLYLGDGTMVNASTYGRPVRVSQHRWPGDAYLGATRPAATGDPGLLPPRPAPEPAPGPVPEEFAAPPAALPDGLLAEAAGRSAGRAGRPAPVPAAAVPAAPVPAAAVPAAPVPAAPVPAAPVPAAPVAAAAPAPAVGPPGQPAAGSGGTLVATRDRSATVAATRDHSGVLRVPAGVLDGLGPGEPVELTTADVTDEYVVRSREEGPEPAAQGPALVAPGHDGRWVSVRLE